MNTTELETKRKRIETGVKIAAALGIGFFVAPFVFVAIKGLVGLLAAAVIGVAAINFAPYVGAKIANWRLKAIKHEASKNPIETLQNEFQRRSSSLADFLKGIRNFEAEVNVFAEKLKGFVKTYPDEAENFKDQLAKMRQLLAFRKEKYDEANKNLNMFSMEIRKAQAIWDMSHAAMAAANAGGSVDEEFLSKIQTETALDSVQKAMSTAFADLEIALMDQKSTAKQKDLVEPAVKSDKIPAQTTPRQAIS